MPICNKPFNDAQVKSLFDREAILIGSRDVVPIYRVKQLFGEGAAQFVWKPCENDLSNAFGIGNRNLGYVNYRGFQMAASYFNVEVVCRDIPEEEDMLISPSN